VKFLVVVQARMGSSRLPGKVLLPLAGRPLLARMIERVRSAKTPINLVVATTTAAEDQPIRDLCSDLGVHCYSGHPLDLLDRHYRAACDYGGDVVVKIPSDCPLIDPRVIDRVLACATETPARYDFVSNLHPPSYPDGNDVEAMPFPILETAWREARDPLDREHTTPFIWRQPGRFQLRNVVWETGKDFSSSHRWTIDYPEDYAFIKTVFEELYTPMHPIFSMEDILHLLEVRPDISALNAIHSGKFWYRDPSAILHLESEPTREVVR